jgi:hypothetical protein
MARRRVEPRGGVKSPQKGGEILCHRTYDQKGGWASYRGQSRLVFHGRSYEL